ncbi:MAG TPA: cytochrome P460 family protein [Candidatus Eisenbacteria bacterium]|nr:cytochrome P460 family protein [Candidatus Eisenbacteria bacterium]
MKKIVGIAGISMALLLLGVVLAPANPGGTAQPNVPEYTKDGQLVFPANYREWIYLSTGIDMSYRKDMQMGHSMFDNVFVNPEAYRYFLANGTWPDKTMLVLEVRGAATKSALNKSGHYQTTELMGQEVHVKDVSRFPGKWAFFGFDGKPTAQAFPTEMDCYSCHAQHTAVDTTFVQFYPTLIDIAKQKGTLSPAYVKEEEAAK